MDDELGLKPEKNSVVSVVSAKTILTEITPDTPVLGKELAVKEKKCGVTGCSTFCSSFSEDFGHYRSQVSGTTCCLLEMPFPKQHLIMKCVGLKFE